MEERLEGESIDKGLWRFNLADYSRITSFAGVDVIRQFASGNLSIKS